MGFEGALRPVAFSYRLLCPFHLKGKIQPSDLSSLEWAGGAVWGARKPTPDYSEEYLREVQEFAFGSSTCYLSVTGRCAQSWFGDVTAVVLDGRAEKKWLKRGRAEEPEGRPVSVPLSLAFDPGIELFLLQDRLGLLSICFKNPIRFPDKGNPAAPPAGFSTEGILRLQYHSTHTKYRAPLFRIPTTLTDPHLESYSPAESGLEGESDDLQFTDRLGLRGRSFKLEELREFLLSPIASEIEYFEQSQFLSHLAIEFDRGVDFSEPERRSALTGYVASLVQIEEPDHAAPVPGHWGVPHDVLTAKHMTAYSYLGAAHLVADQWDGEKSKQSFDAKRMHTIQHKYFTAFLVTLAQRLIAHRFLQRAGALKGGEAAALWADFAAFEAAGNLIDVSRREAVNRCYRLALQAQRVPETLAHLHRILHDRQSEEQIREGNVSADRMNRLLREQRETQRRLGRIEIFIVTVYSAELVHMLGEAAQFVAPYRFAGIVGLGLMALITVMSVHRGDRALDSEYESSRKPSRATAIWLILSLIALVGWVRVGFIRFREHTPVVEQASPPLVQPSPAAETSIEEDPTPEPPAKEIKPAPPARTDGKARVTKGSRAVGSPQR